MSDGILVATVRGREAWAHDCSRTIDRDHFVVSAGGYELGKLRWALEHTDFDRIIFLQDSMVMTDCSVFDRIADTPGSICLCHYKSNHLSCYLGVYERSVLMSMELPEVTGKPGSIQGEWYWTADYVAAAGGVRCFDHVRSWGPTVERRGRSNVPHDMGYAVKFRERGGAQLGPRTPSAEW